MSLNAEAVSATHIVTTERGAAKTHRVFLDCEIVEPPQYRDLIALLFSASAKDRFEFYINSIGGDFRSASAIIEGIKNTEAKVICTIVGEAHSSASFIALHCSEITVLDSASMLVHAVTYNSEGVVGNVLEHAKFMERVIGDAMSAAYGNFLTAPEMREIKLGKELWLDAAQIRARLQARGAHARTPAQ